MNTILIHTATLSATQLEVIAHTLGEPPKPYGLHFRCQSAADKSTLRALSQRLKIDINQMPPSFVGTDIKLIISDMDSTLISIECIDEIADYIGVKPQVSKITEQAMRGELDFDQSLLQRVALLEGLATGALDKVYDTRLKLNPGAENLIQKSRKKGIQFALVSGGFTYFTEKLHTRLRLDFTHANTLEIKDETLTGKVIGDIVNAKAKADFLKMLYKKLNIDSTQTIAMGDGANDLAMMEIAGLSVAYHAKPAVQVQADVQINYGGLDSVLDFIA